jgi:hypothetical protein
MKPTAYSLFKLQYLEEIAQNHQDNKIKIPKSELFNGTVFAPFKKGEFIEQNPQYDLEDYYIDAYYVISLRFLKILALKDWLKDNVEDSLVAPILKGWSNIVGYTGGNDYFNKPVEPFRKNEIEKLYTIEELQELYSSLKQYGYVNISIKIEKDTEGNKKEVSTKELKKFENFQDFLNVCFTAVHGRCIKESTLSTSDLLQTEVRYATNIDKNKPDVLDGFQEYKVPLCYIHPNRTVRLDGSLIKECYLTLPIYKKYCDYLNIPYNKNLTLDNINLLSLNELKDYYHTGDIPVEKKTQLEIDEETEKLQAENDRLEKKIKIKELKKENQKKKETLQK